MLVTNLRYEKNVVCLPLENYGLDVKPDQLFLQISFQQKHYLEAGRITSCVLSTVCIYLQLVANQMFIFLLLSRRYAFISFLLITLQCIFCL